MRTDTSPTIRRTDYTPYPYRIPQVDLVFDLAPDLTRVHSRLTVESTHPQPMPLVLNGEALTLESIAINGQVLSPADYTLDDEVLTLHPRHSAFTIDIVSTCRPAENTTLMGLYQSGESLFTQCEAEGFRRITWFADRPDVMSRYTVTLRADPVRYPYLLSNGNLLSTQTLPDGRHQAIWEDPHPKPCYLFALVAGDFDCREQTITTRSGRTALLQVYSDKGDYDRTAWALECLHRSVTWDESRFNLELDLDRFMIVAARDFNMGAMENKGLNIFNSAYVLADSQTATDATYDAIESVIGHEYFHNWTGNRITCRDWFQLSLKEGLTVFRDQEFSMDMAGSASARAVKRIEDVRVLRTVQFAEDAGPMAHPVRPDSYVEINNFYTVTIYEKGAEVVRMQHNLVGKDGFAQGMKLYFERFDGQAVTCDDFVQAMADANPASPLAQHLDAFKRWYSQAGTPTVHASGVFDAQAQTYTLTLRQSCPATPGQSASAKQPFVIPVTLGLLDDQGKALPLQLQGHNVGTEHTLVLHQEEQAWTFTGITSQPTPSLLRSLSAPVLLDYPFTEAELLTLLAHDSDAFNRWEAAQRLSLRIATNAIAATAETATEKEQNHANLLPQSVVDALRLVLEHPQLDAAFKELVLTLPSESYIAEQLDSVDPQRIHSVREAMRRQLALALQPQWQAAYEAHAHTGAYQPEPIAAGRRALAGLALNMLCLAAQGDGVWAGKAYQRVKDAGNMTDKANALQALVQSASPLASNALDYFYRQLRHEPLVLDKWFALQAAAPDVQGSVLPAVKALLKHPDFVLKNPNRARSLVFTYCNANPGGFHRLDAAGYIFWADHVLALDAINPQMAARLARALDRWQKLAPPYREAAREAIARVAAKADLSNDVREVVARALGE